MRGNGEHAVGAATATEQFCSVLRGRHELSSARRTGMADRLARQGRFMPCIAMTWCRPPELAVRREPLYRGTSCRPDSWCVSERVVRHGAPVGVGWMESETSRCEQLKTVGLSSALHLMCLAWPSLSMVSTQVEGGRTVLLPRWAGDRGRWSSASRMRRTRGRGPVNRR